MKKITITPELKKICPELQLNCVQCKLLVKKSEQSLCEMYQAIGRGEMNIANIIVLQDDIGSFGSPVSDSERTSVSKDTNVFLMVFFNLLTQDEIKPWISAVENLLEEYSMAHDFQHIQIS